MEVFFNHVCKTSTRTAYLHQFSQLVLPVEILQPIVEICIYNTSTERNLNQAPFDKISKSGDGVFLITAML
jgi:hypothetical protein